MTKGIAKWLYKANVSEMLKAKEKDLWGYMIANQLDMTLHDDDINQPE